MFDAIRAGAKGYLLKDMAPDRLPIVLRAALAGETILPRQFITSRVERLDHPHWEVLEMLSDGQSTAEIAVRLAISTVTVRTHVAAVLTKLEVADREEA